MDKFDEIWKNRFNDEEVPIGDWNTPDDEIVWEGIMPHIPQKKERPSLAWLWWSLGILLMLLFGFFAVNQSDASTFMKNQKVNAALVQQETITETIDNTPTEVSDFEKIKVTKETEQKVEKTFKEVKQSVDSTVKKKEEALKESTTGAPNQQLWNDTNQQQIEQAPIVAQEKVIAEKNKKVITKELSLNISELPLNNLEILALPLPDLQLNAENGEKNSNSKVQMDARLAAGAILWQHQIADAYTDDLSPFDFNYQDSWGWQTSATVDFRINEFLTPFIGVQFENVEVSSGHNSNLNYNVADEQIIPTNDYTQELATPYGLSEAVFRFSRDEDFTEEQTELLVDFHSKHQIQNWSMPIGLRVFPAGQSRRWQPNLSAAFGINYLSNIQNSIEQINTNHASIQYAPDAPSRFDNPNIQQWHYDIRLGAGLDFWVRSDLQFVLQYNWSRGVTNIYQQGDYATKINRHQLSIGVRKSLKH